MKAALLIKFRHAIFAERGKLIETRRAAGPLLYLSAHREATSHSQRLQDAGDRIAQFRARHADKLRAGSRRIEQRPEEIENRALPAFGAKFPCGRDVLEGRVIFRSK